MLLTTLKIFCGSQECRCSPAVGARAAPVLPAAPSNAAIN